MKIGAMLALVLLLIFGFVLLVQKEGSETM